MNIKVSGTIRKLNNELNYGFVKVPKLGDVFFSEYSSFNGLTFIDLKVDQKVKIEVTETERGLFATSVSASKSKPTRKSPEVSL